MIFLYHIDSLARAGDKIINNKRFKMNIEKFKVHTQELVYIDNPSGRDNCEYSVTFVDHDSGVTYEHRIGIDSSNTGFDFNDAFDSDLIDRINFENSNLSDEEEDELLESINFSYFDKVCQQEFLENGIDEYYRNRFDDSALINNIISEYNSYESESGKESVKSNWAEYAGISEAIFEEIIKNGTSHLDYEYIDSRLYFNVYSSLNNKDLIIVKDNTGSQPCYGFALKVEYTPNAYSHTNHVRVGDIYKVEGASFDSMEELTDFARINSTTEAGYYASDEFMVGLEIDESGDYCIPDSYHEKYQEVLKNRAKNRIGSRRRP
ncbi:hypothetical protein CFI10_11535 [Marinobacterium iners]|uniref:hypothetical protein n=1 Tax=Marinobacterium iners TaxID=48076 RepID=UPI001A8D3031|nr:hypothetical protein [Marinobacterium iners]QSR35621.1 hypothetical protein CFI10_11535 [Marinobacterium iners]